MTAPAPMFDGLTVVVAGGSRGIGRGYCLALGREGARVVVAGRSAAAAETVAADIRGAGGQAAAVGADVRDGSAIVDFATATFGGIDALIVNAGIVRDRSFAKMTPDEWDDVVGIHLGGAFACARAAWEPMRAANGGAILLTTSGAGFHGAFGQVNYAAAKAGIVGLTRALALEGERYGIRVNAIAPMASTEMTEAVFSDELKQGLSTEDVAPFALALIHPHCALTGQVIECGGGWAGAMRWQRTAGIRLHRPDPTSALAALPAVLDVSRGFDRPNGLADSLGAAMGEQRELLCEGDER